MAAVLQGEGRARAKELEAAFETMRVMQV